MNGFVVWYVLAITAVGSDGQLKSGLYIENDLATCQKDAMRNLALYPDGQAKWRCHEMTTEVKGRDFIVQFPEN